VILRITSARLVGAHQLELEFNDGVTSVVDLLPMLKEPLFEPLIDPADFATVQLDPECGTVVWPDGADFAPEALHPVAGSGMGEWERRLFAATVDCGVSVPDSALTCDGLYD